MNICLFSWNQKAFHITQCGNCRNSLSHSFRKNFVKAMGLLKKLLNSWFDEIFFQWERISRFSTLCITKLIWRIFPTLTNDVLNIAIFFSENLWNSLRKYNMYRDLSLNTKFINLLMKNLTYKKPSLNKSAFLYLDLRTYFIQVQRVLRVIT